MAIYSLHHTPVGKSTQAQPFTAAAHVGYITRKRAMRAMDKARMPGDTPRQIAAHLRECEVSDRKNARVIDKVMLALPRELNRAQRVQLVRDFAEHVTKGRAPWLAAFHDKGKDVHNPHCHLIIRDRDFETGKRVIGTSELGSTERLRAQWETIANAALERAGRTERIDRRTLKAQGIAREPTVHEGPRAQAMDKRGARPNSRRRRLRNRPGSRQKYREVDYRRIDKGQTRPQLNRSRRASSRETERDYWAAIDHDVRNREFEHLASIHHPPSMEAVVGFPAQRVEEKLVDAPRQLSLFGPSGKPPGFEPVRNVLEAPLKPAAPGIAGREAKDESSNALRPRPRRAEETTGPERSSTHGQSVNRQGNAGKGISMSDDEEVSNRHRAALTNAPLNAERAQANYDSLMARSYLDLQAAERKMHEYRAKHGNEALREKPSTNARESAFGRRSGSIASREGNSPGAAEPRQDSQTERRYLPDAKQEKDRAVEQLNAERAAAGNLSAVSLQRTEKSAEQREPTGKSFRQKLAEQRMPSEKDKIDLERLKADRERDKERGR